MGGPGSGAKPKQYPPELVSRVRDLYAAGHSMREVAELTGTSYRVLQRLMPRYDIERRRAVKRDQRGTKNHMWKGVDATYKAFHLRVQKARGKPSRCAACDTTDPDTQYEWANLTGRYHDVSDYVRLCVSCHRLFDAARARERG